MNDRRRARGERERRRKGEEAQAVRRGEIERPRGDQWSRARGEERKGKKERQTVTETTRLAWWRSRRRDAGEREE